jgi:hypothetical protein
MPAAVRPSSLAELEHRLELGKIFEASAKE